MIGKMSARALTGITAALVVLITLALVLLLDPGVGPTSRADEPKSKAAPREVRVTPAVERTVTRTVSATGTLAADDQVTLGTKVAGRLAEITVDLGSRVRRGQM